MSASRAIYSNLPAALIWVGAGLVFSPASFAIDVEAAQTLARQSGCFKCHSIERKKDGPAYRDVATKYRGKTDAQAQLFAHITTGPKVEFPDGHEEDHKVIKTTDQDEINNLISWILSL